MESADSGAMLDEVRDNDDTDVNICEVGDRLTEVALELCGELNASIFSSVLHRGLIG